MSATVTAIIEPNLDAIESHLERLFRRPRIEYRDGLCEIMCLHPVERAPSGKGALTLVRMFQLDRDDIMRAARWAADRNREGWNLYVGVNPRKPGTRRDSHAGASDIEIAYFTFADADLEAAAEKVRRTALPYSFVVVTGRRPTPRPQPYWELEDPTRNLHAWSHLQAAIAANVGGDAVIDPPRIMRLAGTINMPTGKKQERGYTTELVTIKTIYDDDERLPIPVIGLVAAFPPVAASSSGEVSPDAPPRHGLDLTSARISGPVCIEHIRRGHNLHNNTRDLIAHMVGSGQPDWLILSLAEALLAPVSDGGTVAQLPDLIDSARRKYNVPDPGPMLDATATQPAGEFGPDCFNPRILKRRSWLYGDLLLRGYLTTMIAPPGVGKSTLTIQIAIACALGLDWAGWSYRGKGEPKRVWLYNNEDDLDELDRRITAACIAMNIDPALLVGKLYRNSGANRPLMIATEDDSGRVVMLPDRTALAEQINKHNIGLLIVDPFAETHGVNENSNDHIKMVAGAFRAIAQEGDCAVLLVHHTRKANAASADGHVGNMDSARGASALMGVSRVAVTLFNMTLNDAEGLGLDPAQRHRYIRLDGAKANLSLVTNAAKWFERVSIDIGNGDGLEPGDIVGALRHTTFEAEAAAMAVAEEIKTAEIVRLIAEIVPTGEKGMSTNKLAEEIMARGVEFPSRDAARRWIAKNIGEPNSATVVGDSTLYQRKTGTWSTAPVVVIRVEKP